MQRVETEPAEVELMARIQRGDERAFAAFYDLMSPRLYGLVWRILNDPKEAEDVLQEGFLHVWRRAHTYDPARSSPTTWAVMVFRHKAIDCLRARARRAHGLDRAIAGTPPPTVEDGAHDVNRREEDRSVLSALDSIGLEQREAIRLAFYTGLSHSEIAERIGTPVGTIKARIRRGLQKLAQVLGPKT